ncbi:hypothetical protein IMG5_190220 [Ichthyophthirius multifiliis]|uniref:Transmembrane protein n=1 Tax=Ichthyophthirius multifiliis TaxID=5932 RepID=G0R480_ICHMU|nr:hypothetical protein IMG5_190220 [Ichthyophthirius multifiliis]EGR27727.1 hypothetical protein IMG5_190220 [Ichthyophthirius multifiliis]|eukprot:XP_004025179.1 hypothetical protein IMG5_190220 [Ichthyophthirius multifiliis]
MKIKKFQINIYGIALISLILCKRCNLIKIKYLQFINLMIKKLIIKGKIVNLMVLSLFKHYKTQLLFHPILYKIWMSQKKQTNLSIKIYNQIISFFGRIFSRIVIQMKTLAFQKIGLYCFLVLYRVFLQHFLCLIMPKITKILG